MAIGGRVVINDREEFERGAGCLACVGLGMRWVARGGV